MTAETASKVENTGSPKLTFDDSEISNDLTLPCLTVYQLEDGGPMCVLVNQIYTMLPESSQVNSNFEQTCYLSAQLTIANGAFRTSPVSSMYAEANEAPLEERRLKLSINYYLKTRACTDNLAHHTLHNFEPTTRDLYHPRPNGKGGMTPCKTHRSQSRGSHEICRDWHWNGLPPEDTNLPARNTWIRTEETQPHWRGQQCMITREEAQAKFREYRDAQGPHNEVYTDGSKIDERVGAAAVINRHFQNGETTCRQLSKRLPHNSTIFAAEATAITLALNYCRHMDPVQHDVVIYSDSMSCRRLKAKILTTLSFARSWISSGHWATKALVSASAGCQAIVA